MARDLFSENLKSLCKTDEALAEWIEKNLSLSREIEILSSKKGLPTAKVKGVLLHSLYDPLTEACRMLNGYDLRGKELIIIFGFGLGYHALEAARRMDRKAKLLIIEPQSELFRLALKKVDLSFLLGNERVRFSVGEDIAGLADLFNDERILSSDLLLIEHPVSVRLFPNHSKYIRLLLSGSKTHLKKRSSIKLDEDDFIQLLIEGILFKNWPDHKIRLSSILTSPKPDYKRILLIQLASIGDVVYTTPVFYGIKEKFKDSKLFLLTENLTNLLVKFDPHLDEVITFDKTRFLQMLMEPEGVEETKKQLKEFTEGLRNMEFDLVINLHTSPRSAVLTKMAGAKEIWGLTLDDYGQPCVIGHPWIHYRYWTMKKANTGGLSMVELHLLMANVDPVKRETSIYVDKASSRKAIELLETLGVNQNDELIGLFPGSNYPARRWPEGNFAALGDLIATRLKRKVIIFGGPQDTETANRIAQSMNTPPINLAGKTTLLELAVLLKRCSLLITNDTGPLHIACATKTPSITLAGPAWIGPYGPGHLLLVAALPCIGCPRFVCADHTCMKLITPEAVMTAINILNELHKEVVDENAIRRLLLSPTLKEIEVFYSGNRPADKLFGLRPLVPVEASIETIKEAFLRFASLNLWGIGNNESLYFSPEEIVNRIGQGLLIEDSQKIAIELNKICQHLKGMRKYLEERPDVTKGLSQIRHTMDNIPLFEAIEYLGSIPWIGPSRGVGLREMALTKVIETIEGIIKLLGGRDEGLVQYR